MRTVFQDFSAFLLVGLLLLVSCKGDKKKDAPSADAVKAYLVLTLSPRTVTLNSDFPATIEGQQDIEIRPMIDGYLGGILVDEGASVKKGQLLFKINAPQYEQEVRTAEANIKIAKAEVNAARMEVNKVQPLVEKNIISKYELEAAEFTLQSKQAALAQANATLANARTNLSYTSVTSPVNGIVGSIPYKIGSLVGRNTTKPLTTVSNIGNIFAYFSVNEKQALAFSKNTRGATTQERLATLPPVSLILANGVVYPEKGKIETTSGSINSETGSLRVRAIFSNPGNLIRSGGSGVVRIPTTVDSAIVIPQKSTYEIQGKKFVYLLEDNATVNSREVTVVENDEGHFFVVEKGLAPGDRVVLEGVASLREGAAIKPKAANADSVFRELLK
ncbi:efflux RND transporter periplasmic adaptor subunit [Adhaeribacter soli]|uniref:Efflux RND transporter periplasmic adaptor subunit n=1 Tax=Adhaeribacter soli TaxID=2607655 RepID=A0A5N1J2Z1_9BACT|nr:efflux RND transporter periplasmic adaptor subunit [Adhaeribacter soli]KAA9339002.1 efflux RND transporter periplasmic adaptor subunit [Adhaeribacter soli]